MDIVADVVQTNSVQVQCGERESPRPKMRTRYSRRHRVINNHCYVCLYRKSLWHQYDTLYVLCNLNALEKKYLILETKPMSLVFKPAPDFQTTSRGGFKKSHGIISVERDNLHNFFDETLPLLVGR